MAAQQKNPMEVVAELEMEMMQDMYKRMTNACQAKCVASHYTDGELTKGESVCLDRCVAKYLDVHERLGKVLTQMTQGDDKALQQATAQAQSK
ncbi:Zf-Tim10-DDP domain-containing protein [Aphelenchoides fujianensis]|nr:Zf-Tim10-DDP domain-containing protein [Aphelenchoides fujianensis]